MNFSLIQFLIEDKADYVLTTFGEKIETAAKQEGSRLSAEKIVKKFAAIEDGKHVVWLARMYVKGQFRLEDIPRITKELEQFKKFQKQLTKKDLNAYSNLEELYTALAPFAEKTPELSKKQEVAKVKESGVEYLMNAPTFKALIPRTEAAAKLYGANTKWCTTSGQFNRYAKQGDLIIIICKVGSKDRKFQFHFETGQFMNELDQRANAADLTALASCPQYVPFLEMLIDKYHG